MSLRRIKFIALIVVFMTIVLFNSHANNINIIPKPLKIEESKGEKFEIKSSTSIVYDKEFKDVAQLLADYIFMPTALKLKTEISTNKKIDNIIYLKLDNEIENKEGYELTINSKGVYVEAKTTSGAFYAVQTLLQLLPATIESEKFADVNLTLPGVTIADEPLHEWRGMMFDVSRYFFPKEYIFRLIDLMAMYKMNILHLHLIDDSGWRLEIKKYPRLTSVGSFRGEGENRSGGYYTQEDIKEMVKYGQLRGVEIVPELEFPAHILSGVVAYPWLSCRNEQLKMPVQHDISKDLICVGKETSMQFLADIIKETSELFPSKYIHVGGDEANYEYWKECPHCQKVMKDNNLSEASQLQAYLTSRVAEMAAKHGRTIVGWDEILERGKVDHQVVSMIWRKMGSIDHILETGNKAVFAPHKFTYFDFPESNLPGEVKAANWSGPISVEKCYNTPISEYESNKSIIGVEGCMWTDQFIHGTILQEIDVLNENRSEKYVEYFMLPRMLALSELAWTPNELRDFDNFSSRLVEHYPRLSNAGYNYRLPIPEIKSTEVNGGYMIELSTPLKNAKIHYTTNGEKPTTYDKVYTSPVKVEKLSDIRVIAAVSKTHHSIPSYFVKDFSVYSKYGMFAQEIAHNGLNKGGKNEISIEFTGKITDNGEHEITFIPMTEGVDIKVERVEIYKRNELTAAADVNTSVTNEPLTTKVVISEWQAGTPYTGRVVISSSTANKGNVAILIKRK